MTEFELRDAMQLQHYASVRAAVEATHEARLALVLGATRQARRIAPLAVHLA